MLGRGCDGIEASGAGGCAAAGFAGAIGAAGAGFAAGFTGFFATGLGSGVIWACYYDVAEGIVQLAPGGLADSRLAYTAMSLALEQFVWCPIVFSAFQIPAAVFQNGGTVREVRV